MNRRAQAVEKQTSGPLQHVLNTFMTSSIIRRILASCSLEQCPYLPQHDHDRDCKVCVIVVHAGNF